MGKDKKQVKVDAASDQDFEMDNIDESAMFDEKGIMHSTLNTPEIDQETQKLLIEQVKQQLTHQDLIYTKTLTRINWNKIELDGISGEKAKDEFMKIIKPVRKVKSLAEVIGELERNPKKYCSDLPKQPPNAMFLYINENRERLIEKKGKLPLAELTRIAADKFKKLPDHKRAVWEEKAKRLKEEYTEKMENFYQNHPDLRKAPAKRAEPKMDTPFNYFVHTKQQNSQVQLNREDLRNEWKILSPNEKVEYIKAVLEAPEDGRKKFISKDERKIVDMANGMPERPLTAFTFFVKDYNQKHKGESNLFKEAATAWAHLEQKKKDKFIEMSNKSFEVYKARAEEYVSKLPLKDQASARRQLQISNVKKKSRPSKADDSNSKRKVDETDEFDDDYLDEEDQEPAEVIPAKKTKMLSDDEAKSKKPEMKVKEEKVVAKPAVVVKQEKPKLKEPEIPIQRVELYFMKHVYKGPPDGIKEAFDSLSAKKREKYEKVVDQNRKDFMVQLQTYINSLETADQERFKEKVQRVFKEQDALIDWSKEQEESSSSSDSDSDKSDEDSD